MSIEIKIPKEINRYEAKFAGPFTLRQSICLLICLPIGIGFYMLGKTYVGADLAGFFAIIPAIVGWAFGWYKPYGMRFEVYLRSVFVNSFLAPSKRVYKTENYYASVLKEIEKAEKAENEGQAKIKSAKQKKYKRSKLAIK